MNVNQIPEPLRATPRWRAWQAVPRANGKVDKIPAGGASTTNPSQWGDFAAAVEEQRRGGFAGVGLCITGLTGLVALDFDSVIADNVIAPWAAEIVRACNSYAEVSPSGRGLRVFAHGALPGGDLINHDQGLEAYTGAKARFLTVTGHRLTGVPADLGELSPETVALIEGYRARPVANGSAPAVQDWTRAATLGTVDAATITDLRSALRDMAPVRADDRDQWIEVLMALASLKGTQFAGDALRLATEFSQRCPAKFDLGDLWKRWEGLRPGAITYKSIFKWAAEDGWINPRTVSAAPVAASPYDDLLAYLPGHAYIYRPTRQLWPASAVDGALPWPTNDDDKKFRPSAWLDVNRPVHCMTWHPAHAEVIDGKVVTGGGWVDHAASRTYNLYLSPVVVAGDASAARPWLEHLHRVYPNDANHITGWLAHRLQRPGEKINHALVLGGEQGIGKDSLLEPVKQGVGPWNFQEIAPPQLLGRFNSWVRAVVLRINEARDLGEMDRFAFYEHCKPLFAAPPDVLLCDEKNTKEHYVFNVLGAIVTTNYLSGGLYLPPGDRRHYIAWSDAKQKDFDAAYWQAFWGWLNSGGIGHVVALLRSWDLSRFDPKAPPPKTEAWHQIVSSGIAPEDADLSDLIISLGEPPVLTFDLLRKAAPVHMIGAFDDRKQLKAMVHRLDRAGYRQVRNPDEKSGRWFIGGKKTTVYGSKDKTTRDLIVAARLLA